MTGRLKLLLIAGARPNFMKIAPVIREIRRRDESFSYSLVHTGQHYDEGMSDIFFRELGIPTPTHYLNVGSGSHARQTAAIMTSFEPILEQEAPSCVVVFGDVNSTLACSIVAKKLGYPVAHIEAGLRSGDSSMPEEINRIVTDAISDFFFVTEESGLRHLTREGKSEDAIFHVGHVMIDNLFFELTKLEEDSESLTISSELKSTFNRYGIVTLHRPSNVDDEPIFRGIAGALAEISRDLPLVFPVHPRTQSCLRRFGISLPSTITTTEPLGYRDFLNLWRDAALVMTDSGGLQEETTALGVPCLTLRTNTERPVTVTEGSNRLVGVNPVEIVKAAKNVLRRREEPTEIHRPKYWDGMASARILDALQTSLSGCETKK